MVNANNVQAETARNTRGGDTGVTDTGFMGLEDPKPMQGVTINAQDYNDPNAEANRNRLLQGMDQVAGRTAPQATAANIGDIERVQAGNVRAQTGQASGWNAAQAGQTNIARQDQAFRGGQQNLAAALAAQAQGQGPSLATQQLQTGTDRALAQQVAAAASGGGNAALAARRAAQSGVAMQQDAATQAAQLRMQEAMNAQEQLAGVLATGRQQDIGVNTAEAQLLQEQRLANAGMQQAANQGNAGLSQEMALANLGYGNQANMANAQMGQQAGMANAQAMNAMQQRQAELQTQVAQGNQQAALQLQQLNDQMTQFYNQSTLGLDQQQIANNQAYWNLAVQQNTDINAINAQARAAAAQASSGLLGDALGAAGGAGAAALAMSDKRQKKNIKEESNSIADFLARMKAV